MDAEGKTLEQLIAMATPKLDSGKDLVIVLGVNHTGHFSASARICRSDFSDMNAPGRTYYRGISPKNGGNIVEAMGEALQNLVGEL